MLISCTNIQNAGQLTFGSCVKDTLRIGYQQEQLPRNSVSLEFIKPSESWDWILGLSTGARGTFKWLMVSMLSVPGNTLARTIHALINQNFL